MRQGGHDFDRLRAWAELPDAELEKLIDADSIAVLRRVMWLVGDADGDARGGAQGGARGTGLPLDRADFVATVRDMDRRFRDGARSLGAAMVEAHEWGDKHDAAKARAAYERFIESCRSKFHRDIARLQLRKLDTDMQGQ